MSARTWFAMLVSAIVGMFAGLLALHLMGERTPFDTKGRR